MLQPTLTLLVALLIPSLLLLAAILLSSRSTLDRDKSSPFECGFDPKNKARLPFSMRFFLLAVIFLVFDIEIALLLPWPLAHTPNLLPPSIMNITIFLCLLLLGLLHEWNEGSLDWSP